MLQYQSTAAQIDEPKKKGRPEANETHHTLGQTFPDLLLYLLFLKKNIMMKTLTDKCTSQLIDWLEKSRVS